MTGTSSAGDSTDEIVERVERFLRERLPADWVAAIDGGDADALSAARDELDLATWWVDLADAGYVTPTWPVEYGGLGVAPACRRGDRAHARALQGPTLLEPDRCGSRGAGDHPLGYRRAEGSVPAPDRAPSGDLVPALLGAGCRFGSRRAGDAAVLDGDAWTVNGQKVWTSLGDIAAFGLLLARTNADVPKHSGITVFLMPMQQAGVTVRPLRQMTGDAEFCEVFFDDARVDDSLRLGEVDAGWRVTQSVLMNERQAVGGSGANLPGTTTGRSVDALIRRHAPIADPALRQRVVQAYIEDKLVSLTNQRAAARRRAGQALGPEGSITKLFYSEHTQRLQNLAIDLEGTAAQAWPDGDRWLQNTAWAFLRIRSKTIAGGTSEIQRNILGERVLGLPKEAAVDRSDPVVARPAFLMPDPSEPASLAEIARLRAERDPSAAFLMTIEEQPPFVRPLPPVRAGRGARFLAGGRACGRRSRAGGACRLLPPQFPELGGHLARGVVARRSRGRGRDLGAPGRGGATVRDGRGEHGRHRHGCARAAR